MPHLIKAVEELPPTGEHGPQGHDGEDRPINEIMKFPQENEDCTEV
jgi:hypothetical protein